MGRVTRMVPLAVAGTLLSVVLSPGLARGAVATTLPPRTIVDHVFVKAFTLADGALTIAPFHGAGPRPSTALERIMWSTSTLSGDVVGVGLGVVSIDPSRTLNNQRPRVTSLERVPAFVGLVDDAHLGVQCPLMTGPGSTVIPVSNGWEAVIFPLNLHKSDAVFSASSNVCGRVVRTTLTSAWETLSVRWHLSASGTQVVVSFPACATINGWGGGGTIGQPSTFGATVTLLDRPLGQHCSPATNFDAGGEFASSATAHAPTGPVAQVSAVATSHSRMAEAPGPRPL